MKLKNLLKELLEDYDYRGQHKAPGTDGCPLYDLTKNGVYPDDVYSNEAVRYYGTGIADAETYRIIRSCKDKPNAIVTMYRAMPSKSADSGVEKLEINPGDWVTLTKVYAKGHMEGEKGWKIVSKKAKASELFTDGNSWDEWGYNPE